MARRAGLVVLSIAWPLVGCAKVLGYGDPVSLASVDAGGKFDAGADGAGADAAIDASPVGFCEAFGDKPLFCTTFDGPSFDQGFTDSTHENGDVTRGTDAPLSPPASLRVHTTGAGAPVVGVGLDLPTFEGRTGLTMREWMAVRVDEAPAEGAAVLGLAWVTVVPSSPPRYLLQLTARSAPGGSVVLALNEVENATGTGREHPFASPIARGAWVRIRIEIAMVSATASSANTVRAFVDDKTALDTSLALSPSSGVPGMALQIDYTSAPTDVWTVSFDDVAVDLR